MTQFYREFWILWRNCKYAFSDCLCPQIIISSFYHTYHYLGYYDLMGECSLSAMLFSLKRLIDNAITTIDFISTFFIYSCDLLHSIFNASLQNAAALCTTSCRHVIAVIINIMRHVLPKTARCTSSLWLGKTDLQTWRLSIYAYNDTTSGAFPSDSITWLVASSHNFGSKSRVRYVFGTFARCIFSYRQDVFLPVI